MNLVRFRNPYYSANKGLVDELFENIFKNDYHESYAGKSKALPASNVFEIENEFKIEVLLPGYAKEDLELSVHNNLLTVKVEKENKSQENSDYKYEHREFEISSFEKQYRLPKTIDAKKISAKFENGILKVVLPKKQEALEKAPQEIKIS